MSELQDGHAARYYDRNTRWFLLLGQGRRQKLIHRALWTPEVTSTTAAVGAVDRLVALALAPILEDAGARVLDLGCGVGGSALALARRYPEVAVTGVTISPVQARVAEKAARAAGLAGRCRFEARDFSDLAGLGTFDGAYAIEAFVHSARPQAFFEAAARHLRPGGRLVIVDDMLPDPAACQPEGSGLASAREAVLARFIRGWKLGALLPMKEVVDLAAKAGFDLLESRDLSPYVRLNRPRDRAIRALLTCLGFRSWLYQVEYFSSLMGGDALQRSLESGWVQYRRLVFGRIDGPMVQSSSP